MILARAETGNDYAAFVFIEERLGGGCSGG